MDEERKFAGDVTNTCEGQALDNFRKRTSMSELLFLIGHETTTPFTNWANQKTTLKCFLAYPYFSEKNQFTL